MNQMRNFFGGGGNSTPSGPFGNMMNVFNKFQQFIQNPMVAIMSTGVNIPPNIQNNPDAILNYMRSSGQMNDEQFNQSQQMAQQFQNFIPKKF